MAEILPIPALLSRRRRHLRLIGGGVLGLGIAAAALVWWLGTRSPDLMNDPSMIGFNRARTWQMGVLYGRMGLVIDRFLDDLRQPATQAKIIVTVSILACIVCFYLAGRLEDEDADAS